MMNKKSFLLTSILVLIAAMLCATLVFVNIKPQMHKSFMLELINMKIKK